jgi:GT2 family glycosyltransferase
MSTMLSPFPRLSAESRPERPSVSVIIVVWNAKKYVIECLESLREHCRNSYDEVIVVDNASSDGTPELIAEMFPEFVLIRNSENLGFAKANNIGLARSSGDYLCLVNSDVKFTSDCISPMVNHMLEHSGIGILGPKMLSPDGVVWRSTMRYPTVWNQLCRALGLDVAFKKSRLFGGLLMSDFDHRSTAPVEVLNGWFVLVRRTALDRVGPLDPRFFMYGEDVDWCYRFRQAGEDVVFFAGAEAIHYGGASSANAPVHFYLEMCRANWQYWQKHNGRLSQIAFLLSVVINNSLRVAGSACAYLLAPSNRSQARFKLSRSVACLQWVSQILASRLQFGRAPIASQPDDCSSS